MEEIDVINIFEISNNFIKCHKEQKENLPYHLKFN